MQPLSNNTARAANQDAKPPYMCMEMNNHHMPPHSHAVLNTQLRQTACLTDAALNIDWANTPIASNCSHHSAWPCKMPKTGISALKGQAKLTACAQPATNNTANCMK